MNGPMYIHTQLHAEITEQEAEKIYSDLSKALQSEAAVQVCM